MLELNNKDLKITKLIFQLPSYKRIFVYLIISSFVFGIAYNALNNNLTLLETFLYGGLEGILFFAVPAIIAALFTTTFFSRKKFREKVKYFEFVALVCAGIFALSIIFGSIKLIPSINAIQPIVLLANALIYFIWFGSLFVVLNFNKWKAIMASAIHPLLNIAFMVIWASFGVLEKNILPEPVSAVIKLFAASIALMLAFWGIVYLINAPAKKNFGITVMHVITLFFAQFISGSKGLEEIMGSLGENTRTVIGTIVFKNKKNKVKAVLITPAIHYGPFGNLGGSEFPAYLMNKLDSELNTTTIAFHGTANHDFNPVSSYSKYELSDKFLHEVRAQKNYSSHLGFLSAKSGSVHAMGFSTGGKAFISFTRAPENTEDIEISAGIALRNKALNHFTDAILADMHNCRVSETKWSTGSAEYFEYEDAIEKLKPSESNYFKMGVAKNPLEGLGVRDGIGGGGLRVIAFELKNGRTMCIALFDANNIVPKFREYLLSQVKGFDFDYFELYTTDTHTVNNLSNVHNPLGGKVDWERISTQLRKTIALAIEDLEECKAGFSTRKIDIQVMGAGKSEELISTINAIFAIGKIIAPALFALAVLLALAIMVML